MDMHRFHLDRKMEENILTSLEQVGMFARAGDGLFGIA